MTRLTNSSGLSNSKIQAIQGELVVNSCSFQPRLKPERMHASVVQQKYYTTHLATQMIIKFIDLVEFRKSFPLKNKTKKIHKPHKKDSSAQRSSKTLLSETLKMQQHFLQRLGYLTKTIYLVVSQNTVISMDPIRTMGFSCRKATLRSANTTSFHR